ncbi:MAG: error-prone DNA polymerase [Alphaproteobacteria bacterium]
MNILNYVELQVTSNFSFLRGASHGEELVQTAAALGHGAASIADRNTLAGVVRAFTAARDVGIRLIVGARLDVEDGPSMLCFPTDRDAYGRLSRLLTLGKRRAEKGSCRLTLADVGDYGGGQIILVIPPDWTPGDGGAGPGDVFVSQLEGLKAAFGDRCYLAACHLYRGDDARRLALLHGVSEACGTPMVATNDVHAHALSRRALQDVLTCIREHCTVDEAGYRLAANGERILKPAGEMARLFRDYPDAIARTVEIAGRCRFSLDELRYEYAADPVPEGRTPDEQLAYLSWLGADERYPNGVPEKVKEAVEHELALIAQLEYAPYFLTVHDIVRFARSQQILCQGRGSAANSAVCYCLGITAIDPVQLNLLFERFISAERSEPPDIDVDFEHERREEVIQYIYEKYGRERAGLAATVISYRARSAVREVGKALGLSADTVGALAGQVWGWSNEGVAEDVARELGLDPTDHRLALTLELTRELISFPRHLSQHVGGFVITKGRLDDLVPIENAAMENRTAIEWDKDDLQSMGMLKIDVLGLGMLTCIRRAFDLLAHHYGKRYELATIPQEDPAVYDMLCQADSLGVFQVESRAQMAFLPRMRPRTFYDLVIEVAIVRPGPIQGDMVHPYLRRRNGEEMVNFPSEELRDVLGKTMGVPLFQEQAMKIAIVAAGFTPSESDGLRRAMATFRHHGTIHSFRDKFINGMTARGYESDFAERCFRQIEGFGDYGFPESHAASFALLVYVSAWLKCHYPDVFAAALLNSQPMGFYAPAQIVRDARDHDVEVRGVDINHSDWDCTLEPLASGHCALRLGFRQIKGMKEEEADRVVTARRDGYDDARDLWRRAGIGGHALTVLARADAFTSLGLDRRGALWAVKGLGDPPLPLFAHAEAQPGVSSVPKEPAITLPTEMPGEVVANDYSTLRLSLKYHPLALLRVEMARLGAMPNDLLVRSKPDRRVTIAGLVLVRQRPGSAKGVIFITLEDETGVANVIVWPDCFERYRKLILASRMILVRGMLQREGIVTHVIAHEIVNLSSHLDALANGDRPGLCDGPDPRGGPDPRDLANTRRHPRDVQIRIGSRDFH